MDLPEGKDCRRSLSPSSGVVSGEIDYRSLIFVGLGPIGGVMEAIIWYELDVLSPGSHPLLEARRVRDRLLYQLCYA